MAEIDGYNTIIERSEVESRIEELEDSQGYEVVRLRNGQVIDRFDDEDEAAQFIEDEDYNPERVTVRREELDEDDAEELRSLRQLISDVGDSSGDWTLYNDSYFDRDWVRQRAAEALGISVYSGRFDEWPLDQIDWDSALNSQRDAEYPYAYEFCGTTFYCEE